LDNREKCDLAANCWYVVGATAGGKTTIGIELARRLGGEIISLDSMTIYRDMDIGTAKPDVDQLKQIPHHLIDILDPTETFSVSGYREMALQAIQAIRDRGRVPIFVGGTALYLKIMLRGLFEGPPADEQFRRDVEADVAKVGLPALYERLQIADPVTAHKLDPTDKRRIIRALEVKKITGQPISHLQREFDSARDANECRVFTIRHPRSRLHQRIERRVRWMIDQGLVDEARRLREKYGTLRHTAAQAVGYREAFSLIDGAIDEAALFESILVRTRRFARHQETWFRGLSECRMIDIGESFDPAAIAETIAAAGSRQ